METVFIATRRSDAAERGGASLSRLRIMASPTARGKIRDKLKKRAEHARRHFHERIESSSTFDTLAEYPKCERREVHVGKTLGQGRFCTVAEIRAFPVQMNVLECIPSHVLNQVELDEEEPAQDEEEHEDRKFLAKHCLYNNISEEGFQALIDGLLYNTTLLEMYLS
jgi:hypothetical protein